MGKKALIFIIIGVVLGVALGAAGIFFMLKNGGEKPVEEEEEVVEVFDLTQGKRLTLEKVQIPLASTGSKSSYLQADFTIVFKTEEALTKAEGLVPDIKAAIYKVFENKTADQLKARPNLENNGVEQISPREAMREPVLESIKEVYSLEEDKENVASVIISAFIVA